MILNKYVKAKPIYYDVESGLKTSVRISEGQTCFDSTSEFKLYLILSKFFSSNQFKIETHFNVAIGLFSWKIDFKVTAIDGDRMSKHYLAAIVNNVNGTAHNSLDSVYIEYKGYQDKNFIDKMTKTAIIAPNFAKTIILVGSDNQAFGCYDCQKHNFYCQPIASVLQFQTILRKNRES